MSHAPAPENDVSLEACLSAELRAAAPKITKIAHGLSGAGVYRVDAAGRAYVLKLSAADRPLDEWRRTVEILRSAADAGLTPRVLHVDEERRAVVSEFVVDQSFPRLFHEPRTHVEALALAGRTMRRAHALPIPPGTSTRDARAYLVDVIWPGVAGFALPAWARDAVDGVLAESPPDAGRPPVLSHNDVNPSNIVFDGERLLLLDWDAAAQNEPWFDLATMSLFLRMDADTCLALLAAYDGEAPAALPARFLYDRRLVGAMLGPGFMAMARKGGHAGATGEESLASSPSLADCYGRMRAGTLSIADPRGQWMFGQALLKEGLALR